MDTRARFVLSAGFAVVGAWCLLGTLPVAGQTLAPEVEEEKKEVPPPPPVVLVGANGKEASFAGLKDATPKGITAKVDAEGEIIGVRWEQLDLEALKKQHPAIHVAYELAREGETTPLNLGVFEDEESRKLREKEGETGPAKPGWYETISGGITFHLQVTPYAARGVLLIAHGDRGDAYRMVIASPVGGGRYGELATKHRLAILSYQYPDKNTPHDETDPFARADQGSGEALLQALVNLAEAAGKEELAEAPLVLYGNGKVGSSFVYNFVQWKPERVVAAVVDKGGFYTLPPTAESAKVPLLLFWGEYDSKPENWKTEDTHHRAHDLALAFDPNWTLAMEFRGNTGETAVSEYFWRQYLHKVLETRLPEAVPKEAPPLDSGGEGEKKEDGKGEAPAGGGSKSEEEATSESGGEGETMEGEEEEKPGIPEMDRSKSYVGDLESFEYSRMRSGEIVGEGQTWLPNADIARMWQKAARGELEVDR